MTGASGKPAVAWQAHDGGDGWAIVYATSGAAARRYAAGEMGTDWEGVEWCRRAPELDCWAPGPPPPAALIDAGWWFECACCGRRVDDETPRPAIVGGMVYCSPWCRLDAVADRAVRTRGERAECGRLRAFAAERWPGVAFTGWESACIVPAGNGDWRCIEASLTFRYPGQEHGTVLLKWKRGDGLGVLWVPAGDLPGWEAFEAALAPPPGAAA